MRTTFKALEVGQRFRFLPEYPHPYMDHLPPLNPNEKVSPQKYRCLLSPEGAKYHHRVLSINTEVETMEEAWP